MSKLFELLQVPDTGTSWDMIRQGGMEGIAALLFLGIVFLWTSYQFKWIVPGWMYEDARNERDKATDTLKSVAEGLKSVTEEVRELRRATEAKVAGRR